MRSWGAISTKKNVAFSTSNIPENSCPVAASPSPTFHQGSCCWTSVSPRHLHSPKICQPRLRVSPWDAMFLFGMASWQALEEEIPFFWEPIGVRFHVGFMLEQPTLQVISSTYSWAILNEMDLPQRLLASSFQPRHYNMFDGTLAISTPEMCPGHQGKRTTQMSLKQTLLTCEHKISCLIPPWLFNDESTHSNWQSLLTWERNHAESNRAWPATRGTGWDELVTAQKCLPNPYRTCSFSGWTNWCLKNLRPTKKPFFESSKFRIWTHPWWISSTFGTL